MGRTGIPLRPDYGALARMERRSFTRGVTAMAMTVTQGSTSSGREPWEILHENWRDDDDAARVVKAAMSPLMTSGFAAIQSQKVALTR
jgi:hypothetical protein